MKKPGAQRDERSGEASPQARAVPLVISLDWAQVLRRQQQLLNQSEEGVFLRLFRDEHGLVRIDLHD
jgi:hypothetical protein